VDRKDHRHASGHFYSCEDCSGDTALGDAYGAASIEKFRSAVRSAIATW